MWTRRLLAALDAAQQRQRGVLVLWAPVVLAGGVGLYFALETEPGWAEYALAIALGSVGLFLFAWRREALGPLGVALALFALGFCASGWRAHDVAGPRLDFRYYGPIEGRIVAIDRSASNALRLTLDAVRLDDVPASRTPRRVRVALHGDQRWLDPVPGARVMMTGHLSPPAGPAEPGGFDFQRHAWFLSLGAVGYTRTPALLAHPRQEGAAALFHLRMRLSAGIRAEIPGQAGAFAAAVLTGDRSGLEAQPVEDMRVANIAHLLAISGLHMGLLTGFVYAALRAGLALIPYLALRFAIRKWAAAAALGAGAFYLALSGGNVATERAFIQVAVMLCAVMLDRRAVTLRSVAIAAMILLLHRPETLMSPGFQMSFAATTALVAVFGAFRGAAWMTDWPGWARWLFALVVSSVVAGAATAPFAAAHFNRIAVYGLIANLLTVPVMGSVVIPMAVVAALLWPIGLSHWAFAVMEPALNWILGVAARVADLPGATETVMSPPPGTLAVIALGALWGILWQGRARWAGAGLVLAAAGLWSGAVRPPVLIAESGRLVGVITETSRALSRSRGEGFVAGIWLENDGDIATQAEAALRPGWRAEGAGQVIEIQGVSLWHGVGGRAAAEASQACLRHDVVVISEPSEIEPPTQGRAAGAPSPDGACLILDATALRNSGAVALFPPALDVMTARMRQGDRMWSPALQAQ